MIDYKTIIEKEVKLAELIMNESVDWSKYYISPELIQHQVTTIEKVLNEKL